MTYLVSRPADILRAALDDVRLDQPLASVAVMWRSVRGQEPIRDLMLICDIWRGLSAEGNPCTRDAARDLARLVCAQHNDERQRYRALWRRLWSSWRGASLTPDEAEQFDPPTVVLQLLLLPVEQVGALFDTVEDAVADGREILIEVGATTWTASPRGVLLPPLVDLMPAMAPCA